MGLPGPTKLALIGLHGQALLLLMSFTLQTELVLEGLLGLILLSLMGLPVLMEMVLTTLKMDLLKMTLSRWQMELGTGTIQGNVGKSFQFKLKSVGHAAFL